MKKEENNLDRLKGTNPFTVPEGYMEGLTERIMSQLPEKQEERAKRISLMDRVRPWLYMAAVFAGLGLFSIQSMASSVIRFVIYPCFWIVSLFCVMKSGL